MKSAIDLKPEELAFIIETITDNLSPECHLWLFGSRATGRAKKFSDIDLLIDADRMLSIDETAKLNAIFDESNIPYKIDLVDAHSISQSFRDQIEGQLVLLHPT